jgi:sugar phosphate isomerase/epimerase
LKFAVSNIGLRPFDHLDDLPALAATGFEGLEVALSRVWKDDWNYPKAVDVEAYRHSVESTGLSVVGLHSLFWERPDFTMFGETGIVARTMDFLAQLSAVCRDLGGKTLIYGSRTARTRGERSIDEANAQAVDFFGTLCHQVEGHGTCFSIEPLETEVADYVHSVLDSLILVKAVDHPAFRVQIDAKAMALANEVQPETFDAVRDYLVHVHANEPGFDILGTSGLVDHAALGGMLKDIGYDGFVSIEQRMIDAGEPLAGVLQSAQLLKECYS